MSFELPKLDRTATQAAVEAHLERYRLYKYLSFDEREASITGSSEIRYHGPTNEISDQTGNIAIYNADQQRYRKEFCDRTEGAVKKLPSMERFLIEERYMSNDSEYINDMNVYCFKFQPPISHVKYAKIRWNAFYRLALTLKLAIPMKN